MAEHGSDKSRLLTVLMATHNDEAFIEQAVESVLRQSFGDFTFLIVDDASTDSTPRLLAEYARRDKRIEVVCNDHNLGLTKSLNIGLRRATGTYIARMDADDICTPDRLEKQSAYMEAHPHCDFLATRARVISAAGTYITKTKRFRARDLKSYLLNVGNPFVHSSMMMRKGTIDELGGYDENWPARQDYELWLRAVLAGKRFAFLDECLLCLRFHDNSLSLSKDENMVTNLVLRACYRAKERGMKINTNMLKKRIVHSDVMKDYVDFVRRRRAGKRLLGDLRRFRVTAIGPAIYAFLACGARPRGGMCRDTLNAELDRLCDACDVTGPHAVSRSADVACRGKP